MAKNRYKEKVDWDDDTDYNDEWVDYKPKDKSSGTTIED